MTLSLYYERISKTPLLSKEEELDLFLEYQDPTTSEKKRLEIRSRIIEANLRFVFKTAKKYSRGDPNIFEELIAAGNDGLLVGFEKFDPQKGFRYLTFAANWVYQRVLFSLASQRLVALPIWRQQLSARIHKVLDKNPEMKYEELKTHFPDVQDKDLRELFKTKFLTFSISDFDEGDSSFEINPIEDDVEARMDRDRFHSMIAALPLEQRQVIEFSFGIFDGTERNVTEVAAELQISKERVKAIKKQALEALKEIMGGVNPFE